MCYRVNHSVVCAPATAGAFSFDDGRSAAIELVNSRRTHSRIAPATRLHYNRDWHVSWMFEAIPAGRAQLLRSVIHCSEWLEARSAFAAYRRPCG
jgi:hypothetical protein